jgi:hypothetical protein
MKSVLATLGCVMATFSLVHGQGISVQVVPEQDQYLPGETLVLKVRITNDSGQNLTFGKDDEWLALNVETSDHFVVGKHGSVPVKGEFTLESSTTGTKKVDIAPYFELTRPGRYLVSAIVNLPQWNQSYQSRAASFDVIKGSPVWEKDFGVPSTAKEGDGAPEFRRYALVETVHSKVLKLYFRLTDTRDDRVYRIYLLGPMVAFGNLEPQLDKFSNLHVLYQSAGRSFIHCLINPDGLLIARESYELVDTRPALRAQPDGRIIVVGGQRRVSPNDLPPPPRSNTTADAKFDQP